MPQDLWLLPSQRHKPRNICKAGLFARGNIGQYCGLGLYITYGELQGYELAQGYVQ